MTDKPSMSIRGSYWLHTDRFLFLYKETLISSGMDVKYDVRDIGEDG